MMSCSHKGRLSDEHEILKYIIQTSEEVDEGYILEEFRNCSGILRKVPLSELKIGDENNHLVKESSQRKYNKMNLESSPPILIWSNGRVIDGHHRIRAHKHQNNPEILCYVISDE